MSPKAVKSDQKLLRQVVGRALSGKGAHVASQGVFSGLDAKAAGVRPAGLPHSLFQLLRHIVFWQDWVIQWREGAKPQVPKHAAGSWPRETSPANEADWTDCVRRFQNGLKELERCSQDGDLLAKSGKQSRLEMLHAIASHNSYHFGRPCC